LKVAKTIQTSKLVFRRYIRRAITIPVIYVLISLPKALTDNSDNLSEGLGVYADRSASTIFSRAACAAGRNPPAIPIKREKPNDHIVIEGESAKEN
jgi:hypothetical protein